MWKSEDYRARASPAPLCRGARARARPSSMGPGAHCPNLEMMRYVRLWTCGHTEWRDNECGRRYSGEVYGDKCEAVAIQSSFLGEKGGNRFNSMDMSLFWQLNSVGRVDLNMIGTDGEFYYKIVKLWMGHLIELILWTSSLDHFLIWGNGRFIVKIADIIKVKNLQFRIYCNYR